MMNEKKLLICVSFAVLLLMTACGTKTEIAKEPVSPQVTETPAPEPTPKPTPEPLIDILGEKVPEHKIEEGYEFELFGQKVNTATTESLEYVKEGIGDEGLDTFRSVLPYMKKLSSLRFDRCGTSDNKTAMLREEFPCANIAWRVYIGPYAIMSDEKTLWASCDVTNENSAGLYYCTAMENLDIGHCSVTDVGFLKNMPDLKVLILSCGDISDITPVKYCKNLEYLELAECRIKDISPIKYLEKLEHLNIGGNQLISDFSPLYGLKNLKRLYAESIYNTEINMHEIGEKFKKMMPECEVSFDWYVEGALNGGHWKFSGGHNSGHYVERYQQLRDTFGYDYLDAAKPYARYLE